jgi:hypothetical protein
MRTANAYHGKISQEIFNYIHCGGEWIKSSIIIAYLYMLLEAFLEDDEAVDAEIFVNKASVHINNVTDWALQLRYHTSAYT